MVNLTNHLNRLVVFNIFVIRIVIRLDNISLLQTNRVCDFHKKLAKHL
ncbi:hypothetical protein DYBT9623_00003 [Dyadobacter sp. CECT 9623]|uniref:Uncharacterized protein n=1 Tax=Dyadobacter linearis TaxID=2823330 RepID=A0ABM8UIV2_9BACT|nr:hypothetical protein DYBT9623_00003 [Dyadobacter sp. CECT 9623]